MNRSGYSLGESSLLLWLGAALVAVLAAHVFLGWLREAQRQPTLRANWLALVLAAFSMGTGISATLLLALAAEALSFGLGYRLLAVPALWLGGIAAVLPLGAWLMWRQDRLALIACGVLLGGLALALQAGWLTAVGFRPGLRWKPHFIAAAAMLQMVGLGLALRIGLGPTAMARDGMLWRLGAAVLMAASLVGGQELLLLDAGLMAQVGSVYDNEMPGTVLSLAVGALAPLVMAVMAVDLGLRRGMSRPYGPDMAPPKRRKRRHRIRTL
ncbi:conserved membrane hypothetical protein [Rubrivivax sp. A210]|uniref:hypothetical protein n=1 Tax=Rubrivivax sp. A210 TaxID=2772301 RepID=UPI00191A230C|nr:hypothetical protein [Rubrivivax sp. A210]CAD5375109.1 conserved membrane hypothetical protein [Rubrivivax sp. A210]